MNEREQTILNNVTTNARDCATPEARENYFRSCEAHGEPLITIVSQVREGYGADYQI